MNVFTPYVYSVNIINQSLAETFPRTTNLCEHNGLWSFPFQFEQLYEKNKTFYLHFT